MQKRFGVFGGTFDPPHLGHLIVAAHVQQELHLDLVLFVPTNVPPHKRDNEVTPGEVRLAMVREAISGNTDFALSDMEITRGGVSYTVETLAGLQADHPAAKLHFLIGMDNLVEFSTWKDPERILELATVVVMTRPGSEPAPEHAELLQRMVVCPVPAIGIAGSDIRTRIRDGKDVRYLVPEGVAQIIEGHHLYQ